MASLAVVLISGQQALADTVTQTTVTTNVLNGSVMLSPDILTDSQVLVNSRMKEAAQARLSQVALQKSKSDKIKAYANRILLENDLAAGRVETMANSDGMIFIPGELANCDQDRVNRISDLPKDVFNQAYLSRLNEVQLEERENLQNLPPTIDPSVRQWAEQRKAALDSDVIDAGYLFIKRSKEEARARVAAVAPDIAM
jgi:predicted outer membrane protein